jgi:putative intracellular protease/amidase
MKKLNIGIFIFDGVEVLDFARPFEVFSRMCRGACRRTATCGDVDSSGGDSPAAKEPPLEPPQEQRG